MEKYTAALSVQQGSGACALQTRLAGATRLLVGGVVAATLLFGYGAFAHTTGHVALSAHGPSVAFVQPPKPGCSGSVTPCGASN